MAQPGTRRAMDWTTAWRGMVPVYGLSLGLHAFFPLFAVPTWIIFLIYAAKALQGSRMAENAWQGRGNPRIYLLGFLATLAIHMAAVVAGVRDSALVFGVVSWAFAALFVRGSAPPAIARSRRELQLAVAAAVASALVLPAAVFGALPVEGLGGLATLAFQIGLAVASALAFTLADRASSRAQPVVARRAPRP